ncbi:methyltransferase domain-containing protein [candidate division KSB1 bacterium]|nr:methyltransferase domain-containing protein [candidate division KSB1 bacterium]
MNVIIIMSGLIFIFALSAVIMKKTMKNRVARNQTMPKAAFYMMKIVLSLKNNSKQIRQLLEKVDIKNRIHILDYGSGIGSYSVEAAEFIKNSGSVLAADISPLMLDAVKKNAAKRGLTNIRICLINSIDDILESGFDLILLIDVLHLVKNQTQLVRTCLEKLTPGGLLLVKFEHFSTEQIDVLLKSLACRTKKVLTGQFYVFTNFSVPDEDLGKAYSNAESIRRLAASTTKSS